jgi:hypothetical protein
MKVGRKPRFTAGVQDEIDLYSTEQLRGRYRGARIFPAKAPANFGGDLVRRHNAAAKPNFCLVIGSSLARIDLSGSIWGESGYRVSSSARRISRNSAAR